jgi:hypothetical protein
MGERPSLDPWRLQLHFGQMTTKPNRWATSWNWAMAVISAAVRTSTPRCVVGLIPNDPPQGGDVG